jgi:hypothetical protein
MQITIGIFLVVFGFYYIGLWIRKEANTTFSAAIFTCAMILMMISDYLDGKWEWLLIAGILMALCYFASRLKAD